MSQKVANLMMGQIQAVNGQKPPLKIHCIFHHYSRIRFKLFECIAKKRTMWNATTLSTEHPKTWWQSGQELSSSEVMFNVTNGLVPPLWEFYSYVLNLGDRRCRRCLKHGHGINMCTNVCFHDDCTEFYKRGGTAQNSKGEHKSLLSMSQYSSIVHQNPWKPSGRWQRRVMMAADASLLMVGARGMMVQNERRYLRCWLLWY
jgi:hypothetical protein